MFEVVTVVLGLVSRAAACRQRKHKRTFKESLRLDLEKHVDEMVGWRQTFSLTHDADVPPWIRPLRLDAHGSQSLELSTQKSKCATCVRCCTGLLTKGCRLFPNVSKMSHLSLCSSPPLADQRFPGATFDV